VFNSDITCRFPLKEMLEFHRTHGCEGTLAVTRVKDPSKFGVILSDESKKIINFIEKPSEWIGDNINAGLYLFNKKFLDRVEPIPTSIEREIFPQMAKDGQLYVFPLEGFWADVGQPKDFLHGTNLYLDDLTKRTSNTNDSDLEDLPQLAKGKNITGNVIIVRIFLT
jgi:mannose-1-phosphate guanylyltransferase